QKIPLTDSSLSCSSDFSARRAAGTTEVVTTFTISAFSDKHRGEWIDLENDAHLPLRAQGLQIEDGFSLPDFELPVSPHQLVPTVPNVCIDLLQAQPIHHGIARDGAVFIVHPANGPVGDQPAR